MRTFTEGQIKSVIAFLQRNAEEAYGLSDKWIGTGTIYNDTDMLAEDVEYGRHEAFLEAAEALNRLVYGKEE